MASDQPTAKAAKPLAFMQSISPVVHLYQPAEPHNSADPELILIFAWMEAREAHIAKYITEFRTIYPTAQVLVVRNLIAHQVPGWGPKKDVQLAVNIVAGLAATTPPSPTSSKPRLLLQVMSNGGMYNYSLFLDLYSRLQPDGLAGFPSYATVIDSAPGYLHWDRAKRAFAAGMSPWATPLVYVLMAFLWIYHAAAGQSDPLKDMADTMNRPELRGKEARRAYMYSEEDAMVDWHDVEDHAARTKDLGVAVTTNKFLKSPHVSHARTDAERYWAVVQTTFAG